MIETTKFGKLYKEKMHDEILARLKERQNFFIISYMGSTVAEIEQVRKSLKASQATYFVVKNSIVTHVFDALKLEEAKPLIDGGIGLSLSGDDVVATSKVLVNFEKDHAKFRVKGAVIDGKVLTTDKVKALAALPTKKVLLAMVVGTIKSPITGFVNTLSGVVRKFVYVVDAIKKSKEEKK